MALITSIYFFILHQQNITLIPAWKSPLPAPAAPHTLQQGRLGQVAPASLNVLRGVSSSASVAQM